MATHEVSVEEVAFGEVLGPSPKPGPSATASPVAYRYTYLQYLGRGGYGLTYVVRRTSDEAKLVVKILSLGSSHGPKPAGAGNGHPGANANHNGAPKSALTTLEHSSMAKVTQEVTNLTRISKHFGVTQLVEGIVVDRHALLFMEFCDAGDLHREISRMRRRGTAFPEDTVKIVLLQLVFALHHLHRTGMMHRDVKASNVLLCTSGLVKLGDFGLSKTVEVASTFCGTPTHLAPEVWEKNTYGKKADIWSLGVVLYHILALRVPFTSRQYDQLRKQVCREEYPRLSAMKLHYTPELVSLCERLMTRDVDTRPDAATILRDPLMLAMIDRWPDLIRNSPSVRPALRDRILECLVEDEVLGVDYGGALRCAPNLRRTPQQLRSSSSNKAERTTPSTSGSGTPGSAVTTATSAAPQRSPETALSPSQAVAADGSAQPRQPGEECASPPGSPAEEGEKFVISPDALQDEARRADDATSRVANGTDDEPLASGVLAREAVPPEAAATGGIVPSPGPASSTSPTGPRSNMARPPSDMEAAAAANDGGSVVLRKGLVWKAKFSKQPDGTTLTRWDPRGLVLTPLALVVYSVDPNLAAQLVYDNVDTVASSTIDAASVPNPQRMNLAHIRAFEALDEVEAPHGSLGIPPCPGDYGPPPAPYALHPVRLVRKDDKQFDIAISGKEVRDGWLNAMRTAWSQEARRRQARDERVQSAASGHLSARAANAPDTASRATAAVAPPVAPPAS
jgi:serine/threonine protein kinase